MKTSCCVLCCVLAVGSLLVLPAMGLAEALVEIRVVLAPSQSTAQPLTMSKPRAQFAINDIALGRDRTSDQSGVPREPAYGRTAVYTQGSPGALGGHGANPGTGVTVEIIVDAAPPTAPGSERPLVVILSIPPHGPGEVSAQYTSARRVARGQDLTGRPIPGLRISESPE